jgi:hypothetical protein
LAGRGVISNSLPLQRPHPPTYALGAGRESLMRSLELFGREGLAAHPQDLRASFGKGFPIVTQPGAAFREGDVEADGFRIRYLTAGDGAALVHLHGAGGLRLTPAHDLLRRQFRIIAFVMQGFGSSPQNTRTRDMPELAATMAKAVRALGLDTFILMGASFGARTALWLAV